MTISQTTQELLKAHARTRFLGRPCAYGQAQDQAASEYKQVAQARAGRAGPISSAGRVFRPARPSFASFWALSIRPTSSARRMASLRAANTFVLPADAEKDGFGWRLSNGNMLETEARLAGLFNGVEAELDLNRTGMRVARALNSDAKARANKHGVPIFGLAYEFASTELTNDRGQNYHSVTFQFIGAVGEAEGPTEEEILRASAVCDLVEAAIAAAKREAEDRRSAILPPRNSGPRPLITSGAAALRVVEAPPPVESYDGPDDDIPF